MLKNKTISLLRKSINRCIEAVGEGYRRLCVGTEVSPEIIEWCQLNLGLIFSEEYKNFLKLYGETTIESYNIFGYSENSMHGRIGNVVEKTNHYRSQGWPGIEDWYVVSDDGRGNPIGCKPDGSVWLSDHDAGFEQVKLADSFDDFLYKLLTDTLYEE